MGKLVLQEIWSGSISTKIKKPYNYLIAIAGIGLCIALLLSVISISYRNLFILAAFIMVLSNDMLKGDISDCIYIIPVSVEKYIKARYRITVLIELLIYIVSLLLRYIIYIISGEKMTNVIAAENIFLAMAVVSYILVKNTWLLYINFGIRELQDYKCAQGLSLFWLFCVDIYVETAGDKITDIVPLLVGILAAVGFVTYAVYICMYVKKYLIIKTYK